MARSSMGMPKDWQAENDCRTMKEADSIRKDSKRMAAAKRYASNEMKALGAVTGSAKSPRPTKMKKGRM